MGRTSRGCLARSAVSSLGGSKHEVRQEQVADESPPNLQHPSAARGRRTCPVQIRFGHSPSVGTDYDRRAPSRSTPPPAVARISYRKNRRRSTLKCIFFGKSHRRPERPGGVKPPSNISLNSIVDTQRPDLPRRKWNLRALRSRSAARTNGASSPRRWSEG